MPGHGIAALRRGRLSGDVAVDADAVSGRLVSDGAAACGSQPAQEADDLAFAAFAFGQPVEAGGDVHEGCAGPVIGPVNGHRVAPDEADHAQESGAAAVDHVPQIGHRSRLRGFGGEVAQAGCGGAGHGFGRAHRQWREQRVRGGRVARARGVSHMGFRICVEARVQSVQAGEHRTVASVGLLAHEPADRLVGDAHLAAHGFDAVVDAGQFVADLAEQHAGFAGQIRGFGDGAQGFVDLLAALVGDDHLEGVLEAAAAV